MASAVDSSGFVNVNQQPGDVAVMVRYQKRGSRFTALTRCRWKRAAW